MKNTTLHLVFPATPAVIRSSPLVAAQQCGVPQLSQLEQ